MLVEIRQNAFDPWQEIASFEKECGLLPGSYGACATFVGTMRDFNQDAVVNELVLEHYPGMTEKLLVEQAEKLQKSYDFLDILILHRVGRILPNDPIVLVGCWSAHRAAAFDGCREMMEYLKSRATFWKKETLDSGASNIITNSDEKPQQRWVENKSG